MNETKIILKDVRFSYASVWAPRVQDDGSEKYQCSILISKDDKETIAKIESAIQAAKVVKWGTKIPKGLKEPLREGDAERDDEAYKGMLFINAGSSLAPSVMKKDAGQIVPILEQDEFYSGCYGAVSVNFFAFDKKGNKGVGVGLNHILKLKDGENLSGRTSAEDDFSDFAGANDDLM